MENWLSTHLSHDIYYLEKGLLSMLMSLFLLLWSSEICPKIILFSLCRWILMMTPHFFWNKMTVNGLVKARPHTNLNNVFFYSNFASLVNICKNERSKAPLFIVLIYRGIAQLKVLLLPLIWKYRKVQFVFL